MQMQHDIPLADYTTFGIGGRAAHFIDVATVDDVREAIAYARDHELPWQVLAGGSNVLVADAGYAGVVIHLCSNLMEVSGTTVEAAAGCVLATCISDTAQRGLGGWEHMYGIPGTIGGAVRGNAGAFGTEIGDVVTQVHAYNVTTDDVRDFQHAECAFGYRSSFFKAHPEWIILSATLQLTEGDSATLQARADEILQERNDRQIQDIKSGGSFFMNPIVPEDIQNAFEREKGMPAREGRVPAGWLIEKSGCKGVCVGDACTGTRSANYVINTDTARASDVRTLTQNIKAAVRQTWGVALEEEVTQLGF